MVVVKVRQVISVLTFYSYDPSSNPAEAYSFAVKFEFEKDEKGRGWPI